MEIAILGLGCFWSPEIKFSKLEGIIKTEVGNCGGHSAQTNYREVCSGTTNHAEVVKLDFNPKIITFEQILEYFFEFHDPTTLNSQGPDFGTQYRSEIFYLNDEQKKIAFDICSFSNSFSGFLFSDGMCQEQSIIFTWSIFFSNQSVSTKDILSFF
jgi:methionine-S-sulfoxide reductase